MMKSMGNDKYTFVVEKKCPVCGETTRIVKTKSRIIVDHTDEDFCVHYQEFNPYYYRIWVCEHCGYAEDESHFLGYMPERNKAKLSEFLSSRHVGFEFHEERSHADAVAAFKLAIFYAEYIGSSKAHRAGLNLGLAWLFRESGEKEKETAFMQEAVKLYDESLAEERYPIGGMTDNTVMYIIGAIYYRLGDMEHATQYLSRIMSDNDLRVNDRQTYDRARDLWQDIRASKEQEEKGTDQ